MDLTVQPFDLFKCIDPAMDIISTGARQKSLQVGYTIDPSTPQIAIGDIGRLRQVLINLLTNAVKFTPAGGQTELKIKATRFDPDKHRHLRLVEYEYETIKDNNFHQEDFVLTFSVTDSGIGIKNPDGLFQPFMQEDNSVTRNYEGTGLGLAICKKLVELMGGRIWVKSSPGVGSAFSFEIPIPCVLQTKKESQRQQSS
jgi:signal transduction histidine kinase